ncbi:L,D-transpeptidase [Nocardioides halotolerans]|uniref:L,D-transpeptidase n=1 Tax=Nocardioides halotolerans TaxID=433660 RepID=UPI000413E39C|nr:L,D-transpeptidase [Nocardioides halotolerans]
MSSHRAAPPRRRAAPPAGRRRAEKTQPRYGRLAVLGASVSVTGIAMLGGVGVLPSVASGDAGGRNADTARDSAPVGSVLAGAQTTPSAEPSDAAASAMGSSASSATSGQEKPGAGDAKGDDKTKDGAASRPADADPPVPADSGEGRRVVFDQTDQRVWLVDDDEEVVRTYLVSGSLYDNLEPGTYSVYSRSEQAWGIDDSGTMKYFVRFTQGTNGAAIGFHDIPIDDGEPVQTLAQLGSPQSHGCVRQERDDAIALWEFAPIGTEVDVTA